MKLKLIASCLIALCMIGLSANANADSLSDLHTYYPEFHKCRQILNAQIIVDQQGYHVKADQTALAKYLIEMDHITRLVVAQIAILWDRHVEFPESVQRKDVKLLAQAVHSYEAQIILGIIRELESSNKVFI